LCEGEGFISFRKKRSVTTVTSHLKSHSRTINLAVSQTQSVMRDMSANGI